MTITATRPDTSLMLPCQYTDPELWFSDSILDRTEAQRLCLGCPIQAECLSDAKATRQRVGVWGGVDFTYTAADAEAARKRRERAGRQAEALPGL